jgi:hypothetical protein
MKVWPLNRTPAHRRGALKDPEEVMRNFWRTLQKVAAQSHANAPAARGANRDKS